MKLKKCTYCNNWTSALGEVDDHCEVCGNLVDIREFHKRNKIVEISETKADLFYMIKPDDNILIKIVRRIAGAVYFTIVAIMSFIIWLVAALPG